MMKFILSSLLLSVAASAMPVFEGSWTQGRGFVDPVFPAPPPRIPDIPRRPPAAPMFPGDNSRLSNSIPFPAPPPDFQANQFPTFLDNQFWYQRRVNPFLETPFLETPFPGSSYNPRFQYWGYSNQVSSLPVPAIPAPTSLPSSTVGGQGSVRLPSGQFISYTGSSTLPNQQSSTFSGNVPANPQFTVGNLPTNQQYATGNFPLNQQYNVGNFPTNQQYTVGGFPVNQQYSFGYPGFYGDQKAVAKNLLNSYVTSAINRM